MVFIRAEVAMFDAKIPIHETVRWSYREILTRATNDWSAVGIVLWILGNHIIGPLAEVIWPRYPSTRIAPSSYLATFI